MFVLATTLAVVLAAPMVVEAQTPDTTRLPPTKPVDREYEIALAKTAAPQVISDNATIYVLGKRGYEIAVHGTNGYGCINQRGLSGTALIPRCDEASGAEALYPVFSLLEEMRADGKTVGDYRRAVADGYRTGKYRAPRQGGLSYMYSTDAVFLTSTGERVPFTPHVMIYWPYCTLKEIGVNEPAQMRETHLSLLDVGSPECHLIVNTPPSTARTMTAQK